jgi:hemoglobin
MKTYIQNENDIKILVDTFYDKVKQDELLAPVFQGKIRGDWGPHLQVMYRFWNAALFNVREYTGNPFMKHAVLPLKSAHFDQLINLFFKTIDELYAGTIADEAKRRAMIMAHTFYKRMNISRELKPLPKI